MKNKTKSKYKEQYNKIENSTNRNWIKKPQQES